MSTAPDKATFLKLAERANLIPVYRELLADQDTPVSAYERIRGALRRRNPQAHTFLLESVEGGEHIGRFSFLGGEPHVIFRASGRRVEMEYSDGRTETRDDACPLDLLREHMARYRPAAAPSLPRFFGGAVGYLGYDAIAQFERVPLGGAGDLDWPDMIFAVTDTILIFDRVKHTIKVVANAHVEGDPGQAYDDAVRRIEELCDYLAAPAPHYLIDLREMRPPLSARSNMPPERFEQAVLKAKEYIRAGDIIQVVLSQRFTCDNPGDPLDVYRALRSVNPSPYMYCLDFGTRSIVGSSPEIHVRCENAAVEIRPIAGTRPRSANDEDDRRLAEELLADPKERAEHIMLVDLARNDLGRVCRFGSVRVPELMVIERYSHVMHIVSDVVGELDPRFDVYDVMKATFPAGTVSGAPKIRAMEIIAELEPTRRGPYAGAVGYFSYTGNLDSCITIRTVLMDQRHAHVQAGAGIVADSDPEREFRETQNKAKAVLQALALAQQYAGVRSRKSSAGAKRS
jgi:anthranilate synthase component 1